jgi:Helix-turn-helix of DDE superfamily endonuclease
MTYEDVKNLKDGDFKRLCGVTKETFAAMCEVMVEYKKRHKRGRKSSLSIENQILLTLSFWREYRTLFHLGRDWKLHESNVSRLVRRIEDILIKSGKFALPGKKRLLADDSIKYTIVDVTEREIERPKKNSVDIIRARKSGTV